MRLMLFLGISVRVNKICIISFYSVVWVRVDSDKWVDRFSLVGM